MAFGFNLLATITYRESISDSSAILRMEVLREPVQVPAGREQPYVGLGGQRSLLVVRDAHVEAPLLSGDLEGLDDGDRPSRSC